jgi:membrane protein
MQTKNAVRKIGYLLKETYKEFMDDNGLKLSAALSYYTIFSLPPLLIVIISLGGIFFGADAVRGAILGQIRGLAGDGAALQIQQTINNLKLSSSNTLAATLGIIILLIGASGVFSEIQSSINHIWSIKTKPKHGMIKFLYSRLMSFSMVGSVGFLLLDGLVVSSLIDVVNRRLFKLLPAGKMTLRDCFAGAAFTAFLFMIGKFTIGVYLGRHNIASVYGAAGSVIVILAWVYYSAAILYFGAEFTKVYAHTRGMEVVPNAFSVHKKK